jgi:hypothetical protein
MLGDAEFLKQREEFHVLPFSLFSQPLGVHVLI